MSLDLLQVHAETFLRRTSSSNSYPPSVTSHPGGNYRDRHALKHTPLVFWVHPSKG